MNPGTSARLGSYDAATPMDRQGTQPPPTDLFHQSGMKAAAAVRETARSFDDDPVEAVATFGKCVGGWLILMNRSLDAADRRCRTTASA